MAERQPQRSMTLVDVLQATFRIYGPRFMLFFGIALAMELAMVILQSALGVGVGKGGPTRLLAFVIGWMFPLVANIFQQGAIIVAAVRVHEGKPATFSESYDIAFLKLGAMITAVLAILFLMLPLLVSIIGIPLALYLGVSWFFAVQVILVEGMSPFKALRRSHSLVKGHWWRVFGIGLVLALIVAVPTSVLSGATVVEGQQWYDPTLRSGTAIGVSLVNGVVRGIFLPIGWIGATVLYFDLRARKEAHAAPS